MLFFTHLLSINSISYWILIYVCLNLESNSWVGLDLKHLIDIHENLSCLLILYLQSAHCILKSVTRITQDIRGTKKVLLRKESYGMLANVELIPSGGEKRKKKLKVKRRVNVIWCVNFYVSLSRFHPCIGIEYVQSKV